LKKNQLNGDGKTSEIAEEIEQELFQLYKGITKEYREKYRALITNVGDDKNQQLRDKLLSRIITAEDLMSMSHEDLANPDLKKQLELIKKKNEKK